MPKKHQALIRGKWLLTNCHSLRHMQGACWDLQNNLARFTQAGAKLDLDLSNPEDDYFYLTIEDCTVEEAELLFGDYLLEPEEEV